MLPGFVTLPFSVFGFVKGNMARIIAETYSSASSPVSDSGSKVSFFISCSRAAEYRPFGEEYAVFGRFWGTSGEVPRFLFPDMSGMVGVLSKVLGIDDTGMSEHGITGMAYTVRLSSAYVGVGSEAGVIIQGISVDCTFIVSLTRIRKVNILAGIGFTCMYRNAYWPEDF